MSIELRTWSEAFEISSATGAPNATTVLGLLTSICAVSLSISSLLRICCWSSVFATAMLNSGSTSGTGSATGAGSATGVAVASSFCGVSELGVNFNAIFISPFLSRLKN